MQVDYHIIKRFLEGEEEEGDKYLILAWFITISNLKSLASRLQRGRLGKSFF
jgi:hypothetical protein